MMTSETRSRIKITCEALADFLGKEFGVVYVSVMIDKATKATGESRDDIREIVQEVVQKLSYRITFRE